MTDSYTSELRQIIDKAFTEEHGGRATAHMVHLSAHRDLPEHLVDFLVGKGLRSQVALYFREQDNDGLPKRPAANPDGEHVQLGLLSVEECGFVYDSYVARAEANSAQAEKVREFCIGRHGIDLAGRISA